MVRTADAMVIDTHCIYFFLCISKLYLYIKSQIHAFGLRELFVLLAYVNYLCFWHT
jgi:hypothetical protein